MAYLIGPSIYDILNDYKSDGAYEADRAARKRVNRLLHLVKAQGDIFTHDVLYEILTRYDDTMVEGKKDAQFLAKEIRNLKKEVKDGQKEIKRLRAEVEKIKNSIDD